MEWNPETGNYEESEDDLWQMDSASANDVMVVGGPTFSGIRKKNVKKRMPQQGTPLLPKGNQSGRSNNGFYQRLYKRDTVPESGAYGGSEIPRKGSSINSRVKNSKTGINFDAKGRRPGTRGG